MTTIADQSDVTVWPWQVWAVLALILLAARVIVVARRKHTSRLTADRLVCQSAGCDHDASVWVRAGFDNWLVCPRCHEELSARQRWSA